MTTPARRSRRPLTVYVVGVIALGVTGVALSAVTAESGWALVCVTASGVALAALV
ncbi:hypothetical protein [Cellulomonas endometrii]|uniref:hypothetical protein n=1 Tax=Cellulomonas endometrii TaxID=3036301 RepID=UPI0024AE7E9C|nr:hypothetical protein [Cellulomonas endometrii]